MCKHTKRRPANHTINLMNKITILTNTNWAHSLTVVKQLIILINFNATNRGVFMFNFEQFWFVSKQQNLDKNLIENKNINEFREKKSSFLDY